MSKEYRSWKISALGFLAHADEDVRVRRVILLILLDNIQGTVKVLSMVRYACIFTSIR